LARLSLASSLTAPPPPALPPPPLHDALPIYPAQHPALPGEGLAGIDPGEHLIQSASGLEFLGQFGLLPTTLRALLGSRPNWPRKDRKSTRLNSSHVSTSYAVLCLKKNNHDHT